MMSVIEKNNLRVCSIQDFLNINIDIGLSVNYHRIIDVSILEHCCKGFYNIHHSYNLRLRGRNITTHVILNTLRDNLFYHGTCIHRMVSELDAGPIIASYSVKIEKTDTAYTLFQKADESAMDMIKEWVPRIAFQTVYSYESPLGGVHYYKNSDLPEKLIEPDQMSEETLNVYVRAFDFPGKEPVYFLKGNNKVHLVFKKRDEFQNLIRIGNREYYTDFQ